jgi:hypothetical protein
VTIEDITKRAMPQMSDCKLWDVRESLQSAIASHALYCLLYLTNERLKMVINDRRKLSQ